MNTWEDGLVKSDIDVLEQIAQNVKNALGKSLESLYVAGCELQKSHAILKEEHRWVAWIETTFKPGWRKTAWRLMVLAEKMEKPHRKGLLSQFGTSAAYELCKDDEALEKATKEAEAGKPITHGRAKQLVKQQQEEDKAAATAALDGLPPEQQATIRRKAREKAERDEREKQIEEGLTYLQRARTIFDAFEGKRARGIVSGIDNLLRSARKLAR